MAYGLKVSSCDPLINPEPTKYKGCAYDINYRNPELVQYNQK